IVPINVSRRPAIREPDFIAAGFRDGLVSDQADLHPPSFRRSGASANNQSVGPIRVVGYRALRVWRGRPELFFKAAVFAKLLGQRLSMKSTALLALLIFAAPSCSQSDDVTGTVDGCAAELYPSYNPKVLEQCVAVCKKCEPGVT